jgi:hypothetical protein
VVGVAPHVEHQVVEGRIILLAYCLPLWIGFETDFAFKQNDIVERWVGAAEFAKVLGSPRVLLHRPPHLQADVYLSMDQLSSVCPHAAMSHQAPASEIA